MAGGLFALLDDVAALVRLSAASVDDIGAAAARAGAKAAGVVVDDAAVTPRYVQGLDPARELSVIGRIAKGSIRNKLLVIVPAILLLSVVLPVLLTPILMVGGVYLCYEGAEKLWEKVSGHRPVATVAAAETVTDPAEHEKTVVSGAVRTDFILSAEIMVIALNEVDTEPFGTRAVVLVVVAVLITALVYGVVALIVKMDDAGVALAARPQRAVATLGRGLVRAMPIVLGTLSVVGVAAMLWVGGHILLVGAEELGWAWPYGLVHHVEERVHEATGALGGVLGWATNTALSAVVGVVVGALVVAVLHVVPRRGGKAAAH